MGRPKGSKNAKADVKESKPVPPVVSAVVSEVDVQVAEVKTDKAKRITREEMQKMESTAHLRDKQDPKALPPLEADQKYFEAPDGAILVGEKKANKMWYRNLHGPNKGGWILEKR